MIVWLVSHDTMCGCVWVDVCVRARSYHRRSWSAGLGSAIQQVVESVTDVRVGI